MYGSLADAWKYTWTEIWEPLEQWESDEEESQSFSSEIYTELYIELERTLKNRLKTADEPKFRRIYTDMTNDVDMARTFIREISSNQFSGDPTIDPTLTKFFSNVHDVFIFIDESRKEDELTNKQLECAFMHQISSDQFSGDPALARFFQNAYDVFNEFDEGLCQEFVRLLKEFLASRNLRYELQPSPFRLHPHLPGIFAALFAGISNAAEQDGDLSELMKDFEHSFYSVSQSHRETDMKTCISKACMLAEKIGSLNPDKGKANTLGAMCDRIPCWPHAKLQEAVKSIYHFCCDYPGIRHAGDSASRIRSLEVTDSIIVPLMLLTASGYFLTLKDITEITGIYKDGA
jgi:hypothetical protein